MLGIVILILSYESYKLIWEISYIIFRQKILGLANYLEELYTCGLLVLDF